MRTTLRLPKLNQVTITDPLWSRYAALVADVMVPYQWNVLNDRVPEAGPSHCVRNFRIAAGEERGERRGVVFLDSDLYKWLEAVSYCIQNGSGARYMDIAEEAVELISRAQQPDGYLNTYYTLTEPGGRWSNLVEGHELYCAGYLIEAAVAYYEATGKEKLLCVARRFADLICATFGPGEGQIHGYPGHEEIELALVKLYRCTGEASYLACAKFFIEERGTKPSYFEAEIARRDGRVLFDEFRNYQLSYAQAHLPVREQQDAVGHAVRAMYLYCAMADLAAEYEDEGLLNACRALWKSTTERRMYITGGIGSSGLLECFTADYDLPNAQAYCETCASVGLALFGRRMALVEADAAYYGAVERALYNTVLAGVGWQGDRYFYSNPLEVWPDSRAGFSHMKHVRPERQPWYNVACCPSNAARTLASLGQYVYALGDDTVYLQLFISSSLRAVVGGGTVDVAADADLMRTGVRIKVASEAPLRVAIRVPAYANAPAFLLDGVPVTPIIENGYAVLACAGGEHGISIDFHIEPRWIMADPRVREDTGKAALTLGPFVYCLEEVDNGGDLSSLFVKPSVPMRMETLEGLPGELPALAYEAGRFTRPGNGLYTPAGAAFEPAPLRAVPYGLWGNRGAGEMLVWQKQLFR